MVCQCGSEVPTTPAQTSATPAPSSNTTTALWETSASFQSTPSTSAPTTTSAPATTPSPNATKGVNSTSTFANASTGNRALLDPRTVQQMAGTTTAVVVSVVAASVAASLAGASSGPGALAVIGEVQIMSQLGKVGGGKGALKQFRSPLSDFCVVTRAFSFLRAPICTVFVCAFAFTCALTRSHKQRQLRVGQRRAAFLFISWRQRAGACCCHPDRR